MQELAEMPSFDGFLSVRILIWAHKPGSMNREPGEMYASAHIMARLALEDLDVYYTVRQEYGEIFAQVTWNLPDGSRHKAMVPHYFDCVEQLRKIVQRALAEQG